ncbi:hypothetical protein JW898_04640 [Candidatus Woesearchaeota archaeon]|nr:hypothetical protein [Candidatus Woesearchaeota archaeon]
MSIDDCANGSQMFQRLNDKSLQTWPPQRLAGLYASIIMYWKSHDPHPVDIMNMDTIQARLMSMSLPEKLRVYHLLAPGEVRDIYKAHILSPESQN